MGKLAWVFSALLFIASSPLWAQDKIPLLISDHHADHMEFFFKYGRSKISTLIVLDAHADTVINEHSEQIGRRMYTTDPALVEDLKKLAGNHNWIHPLAGFTGFPMETLIWVNVIQGYPRSSKLDGFRKTTSAWNRSVKAIDLSVNDLHHWEFTSTRPSVEILFVSIDLDFFYAEDYSPDDVPAVFDVLFDCLSRWQGKTAWAVCLSRPWLPDDRYAWRLLESCLQWLVKRPEFATPEITLFDNTFIDTSRTAQMYRAAGKNMPFLSEADAPDSVKVLIQKLKERTDEY